MMLHCEGLRLSEGGIGKSISAMGTSVGGWVSSEGTCTEKEKPEGRSLVSFTAMWPSHLCPIQSSPGRIKNQYNFWVQFPPGANSFLSWESESPQKSPASLG